MAEEMLTDMSAIYELLVTIDYPDAVTGSLRHATDSVRAILERTRGDVTTAVRQSRLEEALRAAQVTWADPSAKRSTHFCVPSKETSARETTGRATT